MNLGKLTLVITISSYLENISEVSEKAAPCYQKKVEFRVSQRKNLLK
jgi:hypothetical protein